MNEQVIPLLTPDAVVLDTLYSDHNGSVYGCSYLEAGTMLYSGSKVAELKAKVDELSAEVARLTHLLNEQSRCCGPRISYV